MDARTRDLEDGVNPLLAGLDADHRLVARWLNE